MNRDDDKKMLLEMPKEKLVELIFMQMRNLWAVDGLYFLGIEEKFGTESATVIDAQVWEVMGKIEARRVKETIGLKGSDIPSIIEALRYTSWALDLENKEVEIKGDRAVFRNVNCRIQQTRQKKGLSEFPCKRVRWGYLKGFAKELNPNAEVVCKTCPPDKRPANLWCEWEFKMAGDK